MPFGRIYAECCLPLCSQSPRFKYQQFQGTRVCISLPLSFAPSPTIRSTLKSFYARFILMEKELLRAFEAAEKAGEAAAAEGGLAEEDRCLDALKWLRKMPVTTKDLVNTQVGKRIRSLTRHLKPRIQSVATDLFKFWRSIVIEETRKDGKKSSSSADINLTKTETKSERSDAAKVDKTSKADSSKTNIHSKSESMKVEKFASDRCLVSEKIFKADAVKIEKAMKGESGSGHQGGKVLKGRAADLSYQEAFDSY